MYELNFSKANILIVGDIMLDEYYYGGVSRISPEAPVPVVNIDKKFQSLGGAGNVANNITHLFGSCSMLGVVGKDEAGNKIINMLDKLKIKHNFIDNRVPTTTKLRVVGGKQQIVRLDFEEICHLNEENHILLKNNIKKEMGNVQVVIISDYGKGVCSNEICKFIIDLASSQNKFVIVDPKGSDWSKYCGVSVITPNVKELQEVYGNKVLNTDEDVIKAGKAIRALYNIQYLVVTRSEKGITLISESNVTNIPTQAQEVFDVSGAGDTVVAVISVCIACGFSIFDAVKIANAAAGIVVGKLETAPILIDELVNAVSRRKFSKVLPLNELLPIIYSKKKLGKKIVFTNGCFDILHIGHVNYLRKAKQYGDILVLGLNSDASVKRLKGTDRPINNEFDRALILEALEVIDYVTIFEDDTPINLIKAIKPDYLVKGGDYKVCDVVGREYAGDVIIIDFVNGYSTTGVINKMRSI